ncbi:MAG: hypothetical protein ABGX27_00400 [Desulfurobacteriaceae bacterium]
MSRLWVIVNIILGVVFIFSFSANIFLYKDSIIKRYFSEEEKVNTLKINKPKENGNNENHCVNNDNEYNDLVPFLPETNNENYSEEKFGELEDRVPSLFVKVKEGIVYHPALVFKVYGTNNGTSIHLLTLSTMEWQFIKTIFSKSKIFFEPTRVYLCEDGIIDVNYVVEKFWPPEVQKGKLKGMGILATPIEDGSFRFDKFYGNCTDNGFVFNMEGKLAGICFGDKFINYNEIYSEIPNECQLIYEKGVKGDGNLQGENR